MAGGALAQDSVRQDVKPLPPLRDRIAESVLDSRVKQWIIEKKTVAVYESQTKPCWRYCHDENSVTVAPFFSGGTTGTQYKLVQTRTLAESLADIARRRLKVGEMEQEQIDSMTNDYPEE